MDLRSQLREIPDYPKEGILFFDISPLLGNGEAFKKAIDDMAEQFKDKGATKIAAAEARGFIFGAALAYKLGIGFVPIRKPGKLPYKTKEFTYELEYGTDTLCIHEDAIHEGEKILLVDDLLATGGTAEGMVELVKVLGGEIVGVSFLIELAFLNGRDKFKDLYHDCLICIKD